MSFPERDSVWNEGSTIMMFVASLFHHTLLCLMIPPQKNGVSLLNHGFNRDQDVNDHNN